jgi:folate-dependent phosphoribosylglycinamide formyltransferase PurN
VTSEPALSIALLTNGNRHGGAIHRALLARGIELDAVVCEVVPLRAALRRAARRGTARERIVSLARWARRTERVLRARRTYRRNGARVVTTGALNSVRMLRDVSAIRPDLLLLGGIGILGADLIAIPRHGVLNAHPALLPWARGTAVVARSLERGVAVGATCHYVDTEIDHGAIVERRLADVAGAGSLAELERRANVTAAELLADVVADAVRTGAPPNGVEERSDDPICRRMSPGERRAVDALVRRGRADELFAAWRERDLTPG